MSTSASLGPHGGQRNSETSPTANRRLNREPPAQPRVAGSTVNRRLNYVPSPQPSRQPRAQPTAQQPVQPTHGPTASPFQTSRSVSTSVLKHSRLQPQLKKFLCRARGQVLCCLGPNTLPPWVKSPAALGQNQLKQNGWRRPRGPVRTKNAFVRDSRTFYRANIR